MGEDERAFLRARAARPDDPLVLLVHADWLDDQGRPAEAQFLRLSARLVEPPAGPFAPVGVAVEQERVRAALDPWWAALFEPPVWAVAGNVVGEHPAGPGGTETRRGTRLFRPNAKVYLADAGTSAHYLLDPLPTWGRLIVVGQQRQSRKWVRCYVRGDYLINWRPELVYAPGPKVRLQVCRWPGFDLRPGDFTRPADADPLAGCRSLLAALDRAGRGERPV